MPLGLDHFKGHGQQGRRIGVGADGNPFHGTRGRIEVVADRADVDHAAAGARQPRQSGTHAVLGRAAGTDLGILRGNAAERHQQPGVRLHHVPAMVHGHEFIHGRDDMRHQHARRAQAVAVHAAHIAAHGVEHAVHLALGVVKAPSAGPAIGAAEDGLVAVGGAHPLDVPGHQIQRMLPFDFDERLAPAQLGPRARAFIQPAAAHRGPVHAHRRTVGVPHRQAYGRRIRVFGQRPQAPDLALMPVYLVHAPMGRSQFALLCHRQCSGQ
ncbi:hypothetical protein D3C78_1029410 [compost metagenome]